MPKQAALQSRGLLGSVVQSALTLRDRLTEATRAMRRALGVIQQTVEYAEVTQAQAGATPLDMTALVGAAVKQRQPDLAARGVEVDAQLAPYSAFCGRAAHVRALVPSLLDNAADAGCSRVLVRLAPARRGLALVVADNGTGVEPSVRPRVFEPFVTSRPAARMGLGLATARQIATLYGGRVRLWSRPGRGTVVAVLLPHSG